MSSVLVLVLYCLFILVASLAGGWLPLLVRLTHIRMQVATSFVAGLMLGVGFLHLLPHAWMQLRSIDRTVAWLLSGFLVMFFTQRFFQFHHHDVPASENDRGAENAHAHSHAHAHDHTEHDHDADHHHHHRHDEHGLSLAERSARNLTWSGAAFGLTLHTLIDGLALAASVENDVRQGGAYWMLGFGTFLVIILHKPFDAMAIATLMAARGQSKSARHLVNGLFALAIPVGVLAFHLGANQLGGQGFLGCALAFAAGTFLCIAASDLLPELQFHSHDRVKLSAALIVGLLLAVAIGFFESGGHDHSDAKESPSKSELESSTPHRHE
jgi:zinc and cadmium transporter